MTWVIPLKSGFTGTATAFQTAWKIQVPLGGLAPGVAGGEGEPGLSPDRAGGREGVAEFGGQGTMAAGTTSPALGLIVHLALSPDSAGTQKPYSRFMRCRATMTRVAGRWLLAKLEAISAP
jgi:hypothetical protein